MGAMRLFLLFCLFLVNVSSVKKLNNINDLKNIVYGKPAPRHGLQLLFWFAQRVYVDNNNHMFFNSRNVNPMIGVFGFHNFRNEEQILPSVDSGQNYYEVGNLNYRGADTLPDYVRRGYRNTNVPQRNMDRLIVSTDRNNPNRIHRVFITAHILGDRSFNLDETYEINPALILQLRETFCNDYVISSNSQHDNEDDDKEEKRCRRFLTVTGHGKFCINPQNRRQKRSPYSQCSAYEGIELEIKTTTQGYTKLIWKNIPAEVMKNHKYIYIDICQNTHSSDPNQDPTLVRKKYFQIDKSSGSLDTSVSMNGGLQPRLRLYTSLINFHFTNPDIWYGPEFDGANKVIPIRIKGLDASLQLYAQDGKAFARLYIKKSFSNWKGVLKNSWVGFYKNSREKNNDYYTYQYAVKFAMIDNTDINDYDIYQYDSSLTIAPGVQIRFLLDKNYNNVLAQTTPWESDGKLTSCDKGNLRPDTSSAWSYPEFFYEPEFYDANNVIPTRIKKYDAGLQLFTKDGKACARLYIKKTFTDWKTTSYFYYSWVGFYTSSQTAHKNYYTYQYAVNFEQMGDGTENFYVYEFKSELAIGPGVQLRFLLDKSYDKKLVETEPWTSG